MGQDVLTCKLYSMQVENSEHDVHLTVLCHINYSFTIPLGEFQKGFQDVAFLPSIASFF